MAQQTFVYQTCAFLSLHEFSCYVFNTRTTTPNILFCFQLKMVFKVKISAIWLSYSVHLDLFQVYELLYFWFPLLNVSCQFNLHQWEEHRMVNFSFPNTIQQKECKKNVRKMTQEKDLYKEKKKKLSNDYLNILSIRRKMTLQKSMYII